VKSRLKKLTLFVVVAAVVIVADLATKYWASASLATIEHVFPVAAGKGDSGKTFKEFVESCPFTGVEPTDFMSMTPRLPTDTRPNYPTNRITVDTGYHVFLTEDRKTPPLFLPNPGWMDYVDSMPNFVMRLYYSYGAWPQAIVSSGTAATFPSFEEARLPRNQWMAKWAVDHRDKLPWADLLSEEFPFLDDEQVEELLHKKRIHPVLLPKLRARLNADSQVSDGETYLLKNRSVVLIPGYLDFIYAENPGAAWGLLRNAPLFVRVFFLQFVTVLAMGIILFVAYKAPGDQLLSVVALAGIMGGAVGNFVERVGRYAVVDFIDMHIGEVFHWPTYNVADIGITVGVVILAIQVVRKKSPFQ